MKRGTLIAGLAAVFAATSAVAAGPAAFPMGSVERAQALTGDGLRLAGDRLEMTVGSGSETFTARLTEQHRNGDRSLHLHDSAGRSAGFVTLGAEGAFGRIVTSGGPRLLSSDKNGDWLIKLPAGGVQFNTCATPNHHKKPGTTGLETQTETDGAILIDLLLIYNRAFADRYPGALLETRLNHLVAIANETMGNSGLAVSFRLVGSALYDYRNDNSNFDFRNDIANALGGAGVSGLEGLAGQRDALGADLVIGLRPHDIETRGSCGIAFFPEADDRLGANVVSDGASSWSFCLDDVLTHEIGHNLGATHQLGAGGGVVDPRGSAFVQAGRFTTVMGSFGTGRADRFRGLRMFSNPALPCGNEPCGNSTDTDNASVIRTLAPQVAAYRPERSGEAVPAGHERSAADSDGDGVVDWFDALPFDPEETLDGDRDGRGDGGDAFPNNAGEQDDTDGDGIGNRADADDDGDGVPDPLDRFPLDARVTADRDGDGVGDRLDHFPEDPAEFRDVDDDGIGNNADTDDDGDGIPEFSTTAEDLLAISIDNGRILRFGAADGALRGVEVPPWDSRLTFQSAMRWRRVDNTLVYSGDSGLRRLDLRTRDLLGEWVPPFTEDPQAPALGSGFPVALAALNDGEQLLVATLQNFQLGRFRGREAAQAALEFNWQISDLDDPGDAVAEGPVAYLLGTTAAAIYEISGSELRTLAGPGLPWLGDPARLAIADDRLLISDRARNAVLAVRRADGQFLGELARLGPAGYSRPEGLAVTRNGELLVAAADQDAIVAFDLDSGAFLGERVAPGRGGLANPGQLITVPALEDRFGEDPARSLRPNPGLWFDPASDGRGFDIQYFGTRLSVLWYSYDASGEPTWTLAAGDLLGQSMSAPLNRFSRAPDGTVSSIEVGSMTLNFTSERSASVAWTIDGVDGQEALRWLPFTPEVVERDDTGLWGREDGPGWGLSLASQGGVTVAVAYLFDEAGEPRWSISDPVTGPAPYQLPMYTVFAPGLCPACDGATDRSRIASGTMELRLDGSPAWDSDLDFPAPLTGRWDLDATPVRLFSRSSVRPR